MRFLVDENLPIDVVELLQDAGHDVSYVRESEHRGASDKEIWRLAVQERRVILTRDLDFPLMELPPPPGIVLIRVPDTYRRRQIADVVARFIETNAFQQVEGAITVLSPGRVRTRNL